MQFTRALAAIGLAAHGLIHLIGFVVPWRLAELEGFAYRETVLGGAIVVGEMGVRLLGIAWFLIAVGFIVAAVGVWRASSWALGLTGGVAVASLVVCVLGLPESPAGVVIDLAIMAAVGWIALRGGESPRQTA